MMTKDALRKKYKELRRELSDVDFVRYNHELFFRLHDMDWQGVRYLHCFLPIIRHKEPDMWHFIRWMNTHHPQVNIVVSASNVADYSMSHFLFSEHLEFVENEWGIMEPVRGDVVPERLLDMVLIPLLVADTLGNRVGYGKGFYDRFLAKCRPDCKKIGLSYFEPVDRIDDVGPFDIPLNVLVTPENKWVFSEK
ncbi:5-formyltetrahydrofolate cyclo-ligase [Sphingobacterium sp. LRF_L2]|uniref:5-formyltetrahydrofolate cyclo-ligase n=1 Tax=Sphingobacterium sp. LRF_L2 TaxID=3369421 RepID=UPI003F604538